MTEPDVRFLKHTLPMSVTNRLMAERCFCDDCELISVVVGTELGEVAGRAVSGGVGGQAREVPAGIGWCANWGVGGMTGATGTANERGDA